MAKLILGSHTLSAMFHVDKEKPLRSLMKETARRGGRLIEIPFILCTIPWEHIAKMAKELGMPEISLCLFWPKKPDGTSVCGDPLGGDAEVARCFGTLAQIFDAVAKLRAGGITVRFIDGPSWGMMGHDYELPEDDLRFKVVRFLQKAGDLCAKHDLNLAVEQLRRDPEDKVVGGTMNMIRILHYVNRPNVKMHLDLFHCIENSEDPTDMIRLGKSYIGYLHLHGKGRRAPGTYRDGVNWPQAAEYIRDIYSGVELIPALPEPFGKRTCEENPDLGKGLPPMLPLTEYLDQTFATFRKLGFLL